MRDPIGSAVDEYLLGKKPQYEQTGLSSPRLAFKFYQDGKNKGIFNQVNEKFILLQDDILLREIINVKYLLYNQVSIQQVLYDYYHFKKVQLFKAEKMSIVDDSKIQPVIDHIVDKFNRTL